MTVRFVLTLLIGAGLPLAAHAENGHHGLHTASPYAGQQDRAVTSLSADDVSDLLDGKGWGFAKPAELNGFPGPMHVLQLENELSLTPEQRATVQAIFERMAASARETGAKFVEAERALDAAFKARAVDDAVLRERVETAEKLRAELRRIHLAAHLETTPVLTPGQRDAYAKLRGYAQGASGHDGHRPVPNAH